MKNVELKLPSQKSVNNCGPTNNSIKSTDSRCGIKVLNTLLSNVGLKHKSFCTIVSYYFCKTYVFADVKFEVLEAP